MCAKSLFFGVVSRVKDVSVCTVANVDSDLPAFIPNTTDLILSSSAFCRRVFSKSADTRFLTNDSSGVRGAILLFRLITTNVLFSNS